MNAKRTAVIYVRTSKDDDSGDDKSIPEQIADCLALAKENGYEVLETIKDPNRSGRLYPTGAPLASMDQAVLEYSGEKSRDGFARLFELLPQIQFIIVRDTERIARPLSSSMLANFITQNFMKYGVKIHSVRDGLKDPSDWQSQFMSTIQSMTLDNEIQKRRLHSIRKLKELKDTGRVNHCPTMYGYESISHQKVKIVGAQAENLRFAIREAVKGTPFNQIVRALNKVDPKNWSMQALLKRIDRPENFGYCYDSKGKMIKSKVYDPPIVENGIEDFLAIQKRRKSNRVGKRGRKDGLVIHPLSGLLKCGYCGYNMRITNARAFNSNGKFDPKKMEYFYDCPGCWAHEKEKNQGCRLVRIQEKNILNFCSAFLGLHLFGAVQPGITSAEKDAEVKTLEARRAVLLAQENSIVEAGLGTGQTHRQLARIADEVESIEKRLADLSKIVPVKTAPKHTQSIMTMGKMQLVKREETEEIYPSVIEAIKVFAFSVEMRLKGEDRTFSVRRNFYFNSRILPTPSIGFDKGSNGLYKVFLPYTSALVPPKSGIWPQGTKFIEPLSLCSEFFVTMLSEKEKDFHRYPEGIEIKPLLKSPRIEIYTVGTTPDPRAARKYAQASNRYLGLPDYVYESRSMPEGGIK